MPSSVTAPRLHAAILLAVPIGSSSFPPLRDTSRARSARVRCISWRNRQPLSRPKRSASAESDMTQPLAMQKVEGSNPFSRFEESPAPAGLSASRSRAGRVGTDPVGRFCARLCPIPASWQTGAFFCERPSGLTFRPRNRCARGFDGGFPRCGSNPFSRFSRRGLVSALSCPYSGRVPPLAGGEVWRPSSGRFVCATILAATVALLAVSRPAGAVTIGSDLSANAIIGGPSGCPCTFVPTGSHAVVVPEAGVLTTWRFKSESSFDLKGEVFRLVVLKGNTAVAMDSQVLPSKPEFQQNLYEFKTSIPVVPGERLGLEARGDVFSRNPGPVRLPGPVGAAAESERNAAPHLPEWEIRKGTAVQRRHRLPEPAARRRRLGPDGPGQTPQRRPRPDHPDHPLEWVHRSGQMRTPSGLALHLQRRDRPQSGQTRPRRAQPRQPRPRGREEAERSLAGAASTSRRG